MPPTDTTVRITVHNVSVSACFECPLYDQRYCSHPEKTRRVPDPGLQPEWCPLGEHPVTITKAGAR